MVFPSGGTWDDPLDSLQINGEQLYEGGTSDRTFYLSQGASLNIYGWYEDQNYTDWHIKYANPAPGHNISRSDIRDSDGNWQGYRYVSNNITGGLQTESFEITLAAINSRAGTNQTYKWTFYIISSDPSVQPSSFEEVSRNNMRISDGQIFMSDPTYSSQYLIYQADEDFNCVESYTIYGGCEQPFEYVKLKINKKQLGVIAPDLIEDIIPGRNIVTLFGPGQGEYVVTKCEKTVEQWTVTAYSVMEQIRGVAIQSPQSIGGNTPLSLIQNIIRSATTNYSIYGADPRTLVHKVEYYVRRSNNVWKEGNNRFFTEGTNCWYIIQVCALRLNAKVWMAGGVLYVIDTSLTGNEGGDEILSSIENNAYPFNDLDTVYLNRQGGFPIKPNTVQEEILENVVSTPELGDDGVTVLRNYVTVNYTDGQGNRSVVASKGSKSIKSQTIFNPKSYSLNLNELGEDDAQDIANMMADRYCDAETSISFTMREIVESTVTIEDSQTQETVTTTERLWVPFFTPLTRIKTIVDFYNDATISVMSNVDSSVAMNKGMLSRYETEFPQFLTTYTFAMSIPTDATQNNSEILNAIRN